MKPARRTPRLLSEHPGNYARTVSFISGKVNATPPVVANRFFPQSTSPNNGW